MPDLGCIFCGGSPTTNEDFISQWISEILKKDPRESSPNHAAIHSRYRIDRQDGERKDLIQWPKARKGNVSFRANKVCKSCNGGWMSAIESAVKPYLGPMIEDIPTQLDQPARTLLAKWLGLKTVIDRYITPPPKPAPRHWLRHFNDHHAPPSTWHIRIGRYVGNSTTRTASGEVVSLQANTLSPFSVQRDVWVCTFAIGSFLGQVVCYERPTLLAGDPRFFRQVWPHPLAGFDRPVPTHLYEDGWPPERWFDDADFESSAQSLAEPRKLR